jgi:serine O-acetyltransferase
VEVGAGAVVFGRVSIGDDARIGPGVVLTRDVPAGAMVFATPPRVITRLPSEAAARAPEGHAAPPS